MPAAKPRRSERVIAEQEIIDRMLLTARCARLVRIRPHAHPRLVGATARMPFSLTQNNRRKCNFNRHQAQEGEELRRPPIAASQRSERAFAQSGRTRIPQVARGDGISRGDNPARIAIVAQTLGTYIRVSDGSDPAISAKVAAFFVFNKRRTRPSPAL